MRIDLFSTPIWKKNIITNDNKEQIFTELSQCQRFIIENDLLGDSEKKEWFKSTYFTYNNILDHLPFIKNIILDEVSSYIKNLNLDMNISNFYNSWINVSQENESFHRHTHQITSPIISGIFYIESADNSGDLTFYNPVRESVHEFFPFFRRFENNYENPIFPFLNIKPSSGLLILFPSWLEHSVGKNNSNSERVSLAFNLK